MKNGYKKLAFSGVLFLSACSYIPRASIKELNSAYEKRTETEKKLDDLNKKLDTDLLTNATKQSEKQVVIIGNQDKQIQAGADALYTIGQVASLPNQVGSLEFTRDRALEGFSAMGRSPTISEIIAGGERIKKYLTTYQSNNPEEIKKLRDDHDKLVKENIQLATITEISKKEVEVIKAEKTEIQTKFISDAAIATKDVIDANHKVADKENERAESEKKRSDQAAATERMKNKIMLYCGIAAVLALAAAIYSPVGRAGLAMIAGVLAAVVIAIPFVEAWMILAGGITLIAFAIGYILYRHNVAEKSNTNMIHAIEDTKVMPNATISDLNKNLREWNTVYVKDKSGNVITKPDDNVEKYIQQKLMQSGRLNTEKEQPKSNP